MASYSSYKKVSGTSFLDGTVPEASISQSAFSTWNVQWIYGSPNACSPGCCCLWTVPTKVRKVFFELWGAGGSGNGMCTTSRCQHYSGAGGGYYNSKTLTVCPGWQYTICSASGGNCCRIECLGCYGCSSYITGCNLSNFCAIGGEGGCANASWNEACHSFFSCCLGPTANGGDFGMGNHRGTFFIHASQCHCQCQGATPTPAPFIGTQVQMQIHECWMRCGCWTVPYGHGGQGAMTTYCGDQSCCGQGGTGGPGLVKISYM
jgi:hypothetical protein